MIHHRRSSFILSGDIPSEFILTNIVKESVYYYNNDKYIDNNKALTKQRQTKSKNVKTQKALYLYRPYEKRNGKRFSFKKNRSVGNIAKTLKSFFIPKQPKQVIYDDHNDRTGVKYFSILTPWQQQHQYFRDNSTSCESNNELVSQIDDRDDNFNDKFYNFQNEERNGINDLNSATIDTNDKLVLNKPSRLEQYRQKSNSNVLELCSTIMQNEEMTTIIYEYLLSLMDNAFDIKKVIPILNTLYHMVAIDPSPHHQHPSNNQYRTSFIKLNGISIVKQVQNFWINQHLQSDNILLQAIDQILHSC